jgi:hypothetical protein
MKNLSLPSNIQKALTTTAKGPLNRYRKDAVCDSGATNHFVPESFQGGEEDTTRKGLEVGCANNQIIKSVSTDTLNFKKMNKGSNTCHKFKDDDMEYPLLSIPQLAKNGNNILMTEGKVLVIDRKKEELVLDGTMDPNRGLYLVPLYHYGKENRALTVSPMNNAQKTLKTAQVTNIVREPLKRALSASQYEVKAIPNLIRFLHAAAGYPVIKTWLKAIEKNYYIGWPGLTTKRVRKYLLPSEHTAKGHLHMVRQGIKSTTKSVPVQGEPKREPSISPRTKEHDLGVFTINTTELEKEVPMGTPLKNLIATDLPGRYPVTSRKGNKYMFVLYDYDSNLIIAEPIKSRNASDLVNGFDTCYKALTINGFKARKIRLDNEISRDFIQYLNKENLTYQLASQGDQGSIQLRGLSNL